MGDIIHAHFQHEMFFLLVFEYFFTLLTLFLGRSAASPYYWVLGFGDNEFLQGWIWILLFSFGYNQIDQVRIWVGIAFNN
jgi:hypothetical protein